MPYGDHAIDLSLPWKRITMDRLVADTTGVDFYPDIMNNDYSSAKSKAMSIGLDEGNINGDK